jgi:hypothetical protein
LKNRIQKLTAALEWLENADGHRFFDIYDDRTHLNGIR